VDIKKAIEILEARIKSKPLLGNHEIYGAVRLGIEALKEVKRAREGNPALDGELLPGETERRE